MSTEGICANSMLETYQHVLNQSFMVAQLTCDAKIKEVNDLFLEKMNYTANELMMGNYWDMVNGEMDEWQEIWGGVLQGRQWNGESCLVTKYGELKWLESTIIPVMNNGNVQQVLTFHVDKTDQKNAVKWKRLAYRNELTQLPNRRKLLITIDEYICRAEHEGTFAVLFIDVNQFKFVNDRYGHMIGDLLLIEIGKRFAQLPLLDERLFHVGGDEFIILIEVPNMLDQIIKNIFTQFNKEFELEGHSIEVSVSIGVSLYPEDGRNAQRLIGLADFAMYEAKREGGNACKCSSNMNKGNTK